MEQFRFIGTNCIYGEKEFSEIGDKLVMSHEEAVEVIGRGKGSFIPESLFVDSGITDEEVRIYNPNQWFGEYPKEFNDKVTFARSLLHDYRAQLLNPLPPAKDEVKPQFSKSPGESPTYLQAPPEEN